MAKGQGALVGATYGLLLRAETEKKKPQEKEKQRQSERERPHDWQSTKTPPTLFLSLSNRGDALPVLFFFFFSIREDTKKNKHDEKEKKSEHISQRTGSSRSTDCVRPDTQQALKKKKKRTALGKKKKRNVEATARRERWYRSLRFYTWTSKKPWFKGPNPPPHPPNSHTHTDHTLASSCWLTVAYFLTFLFFLGAFLYVGEVGILRDGCEPIRKSLNGLISHEKESVGETVSLPRTC